MEGPPRGGLVREEEAQEVGVEGDAGVPRIQEQQQAQV